MVEKFHTQDKFEKGLDATFSAIIPKNKLKTVLDNIIPGRQNALIKRH